MNTPATTRNCYGVDCRAWKLVHPRATYDMLGYIPLFIQTTDPRDAKAQINERYKHGGFAAHVTYTLDANGNLRYPEDPPIRALAERWLRKERIVLFEHALVMIQQPDGTFEVARLD